MELHQLDSWSVFDAQHVIFLGSLSRTLIQRSKQASPKIQNQREHETYVTFAADELYVLHLEQERQRKEGANP